MPTPSQNILSIDGGGIRGLFTLVCLEALEEELGCTDASPLCTRFNLIAGVSTGSNIAAGVSAGMRAKDIRESYWRDAHSIFVPLPQRIVHQAKHMITHFPSLGGPKHPVEGLHASLKATFGSMMLADLKTPTLIISYDTLARKPVYFKSHDPWDVNYEWASTIPVWEACAASCSAPTFFAAKLLDLPTGKGIPHIDGGVAQNNPTGAAISEAVRLARYARQQDEKSCKSKYRGNDTDNMVVGSFGTGELTRPITARQATSWGLLGWGVQVANVFMDGASDAIHNDAASHVPPGQYHRIQTELKIASDNMDDVSPKNMARLEQEAKAYLTERGGRQKIRALAAGMR